MEPSASKFKVILGSSSVYRREVLTEMGYEFTILAAGIDEKSIRKAKPEELVMALAEAKAEAILEKLSIDDYQKDVEASLLITCDQVVVCEGMIREKPSGKEEAYRFIKGYSGGTAATVSSVLVTNLKTGFRKGNWDKVDSGVANNLSTGQLFAEFSKAENIYFHAIPDEVIEKLIEEGTVLNVAGGLIIEHPLLQPYVKQMVGTIDSVMGLPKALTQRLIMEAL